MAVANGTRLGPYEIQAALGAGGMGEVYRARDTRLDRAVAIKILSEHFSGNPVHRQRFEREAKAISGLNHPNICALYDVGSQDGIDYLVMECVEGETLAERLEKGALPVDQVLKIGREIADALDKAHRSGIIHRDLKPGNIMLTKSGAKLLDFGLARSTVQAASAATLSASASRERPVTAEGTIVGTFPYMSPEQIDGKELDGRTDIFSLGSVLYEMLTGKRAFEGKSQLSVASAILEKEPAPIAATKPLTPRSFDHVIRRCLAKDPEDRWQTARDLALELEAIREERSDTSASQPVGLLRGNRLGWAGLGLILVLAGTTAILLARSRGKAQPLQETIRSSIVAPEGKEFVRWGPAALSPDGKHLVFSAATPGGTGHLYLRRMDSFSAKLLPDTDDAQAPFWSPDSQWIGFVANSKLLRVSIDGGSPLTISDSSQLRGGSWGTDGTILFVPGTGNPVYAVSSAGGVPVAVTQLNESAGELTHRWPIFLPDGKHFLFFSRGRENAIFAASLDSKERKLVLKTETSVRYVQPGYLLFVRNGVLFAQPFDAERLELSGSAAPVTDGVPIFGAQQHALFSASDTGILAIHSKQEMLLQPLWVDSSGKSAEPFMEPAMLTLDVRMSPDGRRIAFGITDPKDGADNLWVHDIASKQTTRLTFEKLIAQHPVWAPDGSQLLYTSNRLGRPQTFRIPATGVDEAEPFLPSAYSDMVDSWSPDGRYIVFGRGTIDSMLQRTLWVRPLFGEKKPVPLVAATHSQQWSAAFSPDGKWIAYASDESGASEIYIVPFPEARTKIQVSKNGSWSRPHWSRDGRQIFYLGKEHTILTTSLRYSSSGIEVGETRALFKIDIPQFEVSPDGKRFVIFRTAENQEPSTLTLITNWRNALPK